MMTLYQNIKFRWNKDKKIIEEYLNVNRAIYKILN